MALKLKSGQTAEEAAAILLGDSRLVNEIHIEEGIAYIKGEKMGPPAKYAAEPPRLEKPSAKL
jgi:hypothetical protein